MLRASSGDGELTTTNNKNQFCWQKQKKNKLDSLIIKQADSWSAEIDPGERDTIRERAYYRRQDACWGLARRDPAHALLFVRIHHSSSAGECCAVLFCSVFSVNIIRRCVVIIIAQISDSGALSVTCALLNLAAAASSYVTWARKHDLTAVTNSERLTSTVSCSTPLSSCTFFLSFTWTWNGFFWWFFF